MKNCFKKLILSTTTILGILGISLPNFAQNHSNYNQASKNQYDCIYYEGAPTTIVNTYRGQIPLIVWRSNYFSSGGWNPESRCNAVTARFQQHSDARNLRYISTGKINAYNIICVADRVERLYESTEYECKTNGILLTLQHNDNPDQVLKDLFNVASRSTNRPMTRGKNISQFGIDVEDLLSKAEIIDDSNNIQEVNTEEKITPNQSVIDNNNNNNPSNDLDFGLNLCEETLVICSE